MNNASHNRGLIADLPAYPCEAPANTSQHQKTPCNLTFFRTYLSGGYENTVTAMGVFSRYLCTYPPYNQDAKTIDEVIIDILVEHAYLPTTIISDMGSASMFHDLREAAGVLVITLKHATTSHAQIIGMLERSAASIKQALLVETGKEYTCGKKRQHCSLELQHG